MKNKIVFFASILVVAVMLLGTLGNVLYCPKPTQEPTRTHQTKTPCPTKTAKPTETQVPPTNTSVPPTETQVPPTETQPPTEVPTLVPPTNTAVPPTEVPTATMQPTSTGTPYPTATNTVTPNPTQTITPKPKVNKAPAAPETGASDETEPIGLFILKGLGLVLLLVVVFSIGRWVVIPAVKWIFRRKIKLEVPPKEK